MAKSKTVVTRTVPSRSNTKEAKKIIRQEIRNYFSPSVVERGRSAIENMKSQAEHTDDGRVSRSNYQKGAQLVQDGFFACYYGDQLVMLRKIYGNKVDKWNGDKIHNTYKNLIGREYAAMLSEREKGKLQRTSSHTVSVRAIPSNTKKKRSKK